MKPMKLDKTIYDIITGNKDPYVPAVPISLIRKRQESMRLQLGDDYERTISQILKVISGNEIKLFYEAFSYETPVSFMALALLGEMIDRSKTSGSISDR